jgi:hypothetical protein
MEAQMPTPEEMTAKEYNEALRDLGLSVYASPGVLGISLRQSQRYSSGEQEVPPRVANHLRLLLLHVRTLKERRRDLIAGIGVIESGKVRHHSGRIDTTKEALGELKRQLSEIEHLMTNHPGGLKLMLD